MYPFCYGARKHPPCLSGAHARKEASPAREGSFLNREDVYAYLYIVIYIYIYIEREREYNHNNSY